MHFDDKRLLNCLHDKVRSNQEVLDSLLQVKNKGSSKDACGRYLKALNSLVIQESVDFQEVLQGKAEMCVTSPLQFFSVACQLEAHS